MWGELAPPTAPQERLCHGTADRSLAAREGGGHDQAVAEGVAAGRLGVGREDQVDPVAGQLGGDRAHGVAAGGGDVADVHGQDPARVAQHDLAVDLRVALAAVADQHHLEGRVGVEQGLDRGQLVGLAGLEGAQAPVAQQQRPAGDAVHVQEVLQQVVQVPGAVGDVEHRVVGLAVAAALERLVEPGHALEGQPGVGVVEQGQLGHLPQAGGVGVQHGVVQVADHPVLGVPGDQHLAGGPGRPGRLQQLQLDRLPDPRPLQRPGQVEDDLEVALLVGPGPDLGAGRGPGGDQRPRDLVALEPAEHVAQVVDHRVAEARADQPGRAQHPPAQPQPGRGAVAPEGLQLDVPASAPQVPSSDSRASTKASGSKGARSWGPSPRTTSLTGMPRSRWTAMTMPPLAVPSSLVRTTPVTPTASVNWRAWARPFWPVVASRTSRTSRTWPPSRSRTRRSLRSSSIRLVWVWRRPAVSTRSTSAPRALAEARPSKATAAGSAPCWWRTTWAPTRSPQMTSCSVAAARKVSAAASTACLPSSDRARASLPTVVVLPVPLTPTTSTIPGRWCSVSRSRARERSPLPTASRSSSRSRSRRAGPLARSARARVRSRSTSSLAVATPTSADSSASSSSSQASSSSTPRDSSPAMPRDRAARERPRRSRKRRRGAMTSSGAVGAAVATPRSSGRSTSAAPRPGRGGCPGSSPTPGSRSRSTWRTSSAS